eukprot:TRINITY_DN11975_c0_g1_i1.p1 TRINITY_DN11975_c0_g1~~TRINITY_DN11975_c0_g1_i1.p1  ORF type:complete len:205 (+),score=30.30 TRINITY_DN11975_c0_g1_i1:75-689(+)
MKQLHCRLGLGTLCHALVVASLLVLPDVVARVAAMEAMLVAGTSSLRGGQFPLSTNVEIARASDQRIKASVESAHLASAGAAASAARVEQLLAEGSGQAQVLAGAAAHANSAADAATRYADQAALQLRLAKAYAPSVASQTTALVTRGIQDMFRQQYYELAGWQNEVFNKPPYPRPEAYTPPPLLAFNLGPAPGPAPAPSPSLR